MIDQLIWGIPPWIQDYPQTTPSDQGSTNLGQLKPKRKQLLMKKNKHEKLVISMIPLLDFAL